MQARYRARQGEKKRDKRLAAGVAAGQLMLADCEAQAKLAQAIADYHNSQITDEEQARHAAEHAAELARDRAGCEEARRREEQTLALFGEAPCRWRWWLNGFKHGTTSR